MGLARGYFGEPATFLRDRRRMLVYLARYLRQPLVDLERQPLDALLLDYELCSELVRQENGTKDKPGTGMATHGEDGR